MMAESSVKCRYIHLTSGLFRQIYMNSLKQRAFKQYNVCIRRTAYEFVNVDLKMITTDNKDFPEVSDTVTLLSFSEES